MQKTTVKYLVGNNLKKYRLENGLKQEHLAKLLKISQRKYSFIENNITALNDDEVKTFASTLNVDEEFLKNDDAKQVFHQCNYSINAPSNCTNNFYSLEEIKKLYDDLLKQKNDEIAFLRGLLADK